MCSNTTPPTTHDEEENLRASLALADSISLQAALNNQQAYNSGNTGPLLRSSGFDAINVNNSSNSNADFLNAYMVAETLIRPFPELSPAWNNSSTNNNNSNDNVKAALAALGANPFPASNASLHDRIFQLNQQPATTTLNQAMMPTMMNNPNALVNMVQNVYPAQAQCTGSLSATAASASGLNLPMSSAATLNSAPTAATGHLSPTASLIESINTPPSPTSSGKPRHKSTDKTKKPLPLDFQPSQYSIICGNNRDAYNSAGNRWFRFIGRMHLEEFTKATTKLDKSIVVNKVMKTIKEACPVGAFVSHEKGRWWEVSERTSREKVGAFFRDCLADTYKSSSKNKIAQRKKNKKNSNSKAKKSNQQQGPNNHNDDEFSYDDGEYDLAPLPF